MAIYQKLGVVQYFNSSLVVPVVPAVYSQEIGWGWDGQGQSRGVLPSGQSTSPILPLLMEVVASAPIPTLGHPAAQPGSGTHPRGLNSHLTGRAAHRSACAVQPFRWPCSPCTDRSQASVPLSPHTNVREWKPGIQPPVTRAPGSVSRDTPLGLRNSELPSYRTCFWFLIFVEAVRAQN